MNKDMLLAAGKRFVKAFFFGGVASVLVVIGQNPIDLENWKKWVAIVVTAFLTGALMGLEKAIGYTN